ncbi:heterokaryon incompatibility protein-domain-containing protein [Aspergillus tamarii]|uniref:Heterokaryon incompatibility protein-domain-containing protein n=1 Tax=Aspergillus tamarii TaxID=41984 RepID=A0A5N6UXP1_ASPTM|nr:heterokaryon incompatibility protein-domain-containing protein [Aspergillus tamarii]
MSRHQGQLQRQRPPRLPTRVINVQEAASPNVNLHSLGGASEYGQYLTLSYCWGRNQPLVALKRNLKDLKNGIAVTVLPQTIQDAVQTTRDLGYQYLWVDALCIIQDDEEDVKREIGAMGDIYRNSTATILAATSRSVGEGYLKSSRKHRPFITLSVQLPNGKTGEVRIGHPCQFAHFGWHLDPLAQRGWTLQESLLARRILYYGPYELLFHCQTLGYRRLFPSYIIYPENEQPSSRALFHSQDRTASWSELVRQYTFRNLTYSEDRPRAISGIVATLEGLWNDKCVFGAWASRFVEQMTWFNVAGFRPSLRKSNRAPSWSWLSIDGHVAIHCISILRSDCVVTADLIQVAEGAKLTLICRVTPEHNWPSLEPNLFSIYWDIDNTDDSRGMPYFYLYLGVEARLSPEKWYHAFALTVVQVEAHVFRRIGLIIVQSADMKVVRHLEERLHGPQHITLV